MKQRLIRLIGLVLLLVSPVLSQAQISYQYWIDNNTDAVVSGTTTDGTAVALSIDVAGLSPGVHFYNIRAREDKKWGTIYRYLFCIPKEVNAATSQLGGYEYWLDNNYEQRTTVVGTSGDQTLTPSIDASTLAPGVHFYNIRAKDANGQWSPVYRYLFAIPRDQQEAVSRLINGYRYGFGDELTTVNFATPVSEYTLNEAFDVPEVPQPKTIDDDCHFSFSGTSATLMRNVVMTFALAFTDESKAMSSPLGTSFTLTDTQTSDILTLNVPGSLTVPQHSQGGYTVAQFTIGSAGTYILKSSASCSLRLFSSDGAMITDVAADALSVGFSREYEAGTYYAVVFGNELETILTANVSDANLLKPTLTYADDKVTISSALAGATFYYTLDGTDPTTESTLYEEPIPVDRNMSIKAIAFWAGIGASPVASLDIDLFTVANPVITHEGDVVTITTTTEGATIYYTLDGSDPTSESKVYTESFNVTENCTIKAIALRDGYHNSEIVSFAVNWLKVKIVKFNQDDSTLSMSTETEGAVIKYKLDDGEWILYEKSLIMEGEYSIQAYATKKGYDDSDVATYSFVYHRPVVEKPVITHEGNLITITTSTEGAAIYYTLDGSDPTSESKVYTESFTVTENCTIKAIALRDGYNDSGIEELVVNWIVLVQCGYVVFSDDGTKMTFKYGVMPDGDNVYDMDNTQFYTYTEVGQVGTYSYSRPYSCSQVKSIVFDSSFKQAKPKSTACWFLNAILLESIEGIENFNTSYVTDMYRMFYGCKKLTNLDLSSFDTSNVTNMDDMFENCYSLKTLNLSQFDTGNVKTMRYMFSDCNSLTDLDLSNFDTRNVWSMQCMFVRCYGLTSIDLSSFNTENLKRMDSMFVGCSNLNTIFVSESWTTKNCDWTSLDKHSSIFKDCTKLIGGNGTKYNATLYNTKDGCYYHNVDRDYAHIDEGSSNPGYFTYKDKNQKYTGYAVYDSDYGIMTFKYGVMPEGDNVYKTDNTNYGDSNSVLWDCSSLRTVIFDDSYINARPKSTAYWFANANYLTSIIGIEYLNTSIVTDMTCMFSGCSEITILNLSNFDTNSVTYMDNMFYACGNLKTIYANKGWSTNNVDHGENMFADCFNLVGGKGTAYNASNVDVTYARFDEGESNPGYLTYEDYEEPNPDPNPKPTQGAYAVFDDSNTLVFMYGEKPSDGRYFDLDISNGPLWDGSMIKKVRFDTSYSKARPTSTSAWFQYAEQLTEIDGIENLNTSEVTNMSFMFSYCRSLKSLDLSHFDTRKVKDMSRMFQYCETLNNVNLDSFDTSNVESMEGMFYGCSSLTSLNLTRFDTSKVIDMGYMFDMCSSLTSLDLSNFNTDQVKEMKFMFTTCSNLKTIYASELFTTANVTNGSYMFVESYKIVGGEGTAYNLNYVDHTYARIDGGTSAPGYFTYKEKPKKVGYAFFDSETGTLTFKHGVIPSGDNVWETENTDFNWKETAPWISENLTKVVFDASYAEVRPTSTAMWFRSASKLSEITGLQYLNTSNVTNMASMFYGCINLTSLDLSHFDTSNVTNMNAMFNNCSSLTSLDVCNFDTGNVTNMALMFSDCNSLTSLDVNHFNTSNVTSMNGMFDGCRNLTSLDLNNFNTSSVTDMLYMFSDCSSLTSLNMSHFDTSNVTDMGGMFFSCSSLTSLDLSSFNTSSVKDMLNMFNSCSSLTSLDLSHFDTSNVTNMAGMFLRCSSLTSLDLSHFDTRNVVLLGGPRLTTMYTYRGMFEGCENLTSLDLSSFNTAKVESMSLLFNGCKKLETVYVSEGWTTAKASDGLEMFSNCYALVGGQGTKYSSSKVNKTYARIDGGSSSPGYFTYKAYAKEDVNGDGVIDSNDIVDLTDFIAGKSPKGVTAVSADVNGDGVVNIADVIMVSNAILTK